MLARVARVALSSRHSTRFFPIKQRPDFHSFRQGDKLVDDNNLILKDADEKSSNNYTVRILGDAHDALNVTYNTLPIELLNGVPYTAILTSESVPCLVLLSTSFSFILQLADPSL